jgi:hypothetical protein
MDFVISWASKPSSRTVEKRPRDVVAAIAHLLPSLLVTPEALVFTLPDHNRLVYSLLRSCWQYIRYLRPKTPFYDLQSL